MDNFGKITIGAIVGVLALILVAASITIVPVGSTGIVKRFGAITGSTITEGLHFKAPFIESVIDLSNKIQVYETPASAVSKDMQTVNSTIAVNYRLVADKSAEMYQNVGTDYQTILITPVVQECMKSVTAKYTAEELITKRTAVGDEVKTELDEKLNAYGIYIEKFNIVNFDFSTEFNNAIEAKQVAEQNLLKTQTEQKQQIVIAEAEAQKKVIAANGEAEAILAKAEAEAEANRMIAASITDNVLANSFIEKWNGEMPAVMSDGNLMFDISSMVGTGNDVAYTAPAASVAEE